jgi:hypothetical protein
LMRRSARWTTAGRRCRCVDWFSDFLLKRCPEGRSPPQASRGTQCGHGVGMVWYSAPGRRRVPQLPNVVHIGHVEQGCCVKLEVIVSGDLALNLQGVPDSLLAQVRML